MSHGLPYVSTHEPIEGAEYVMGIDEAGRGPVLGPMTYGASWIPTTDRDKFAKLGFMDSKQLTAEKRDKLFASIRDCSRVQINYKVTIISAQEISDRMQRINKINLNKISHDAAIDLVHYAANKGFHIAELYVDTVGDKTTYQRKLKRIFPNIKITVAEKADAKFPIVSAASICAKVLRDKEMEHYIFEEDMSEEEDRAYGSDSKATDWMARNSDKVFGFPSLVRFSWGPTQKAMHKGAVPVKWCRYGDDDDDEQDGKQTHLNFSTRYRYYVRNDMEVVQDF